MGALQNIEKGQFGAALNDIETSIKNLFTQDIAPALTAFVNQFASDFGSQALALAATSVGQVIAGTPIQTVAATILPQITADAITDGEKDGTVVLNALRVQLTAASSSAAVTGTPTAPSA